jgi:phosphopantothenoylcysteine decarboxylase/phosphopantothenate--cysteine ligase
MSSNNSANIILGVCGSISAYKALHLASRLTQDGISVHTVLTSGAKQFITSLSFEAITHNPVPKSLHQSSWDGHIDLAKRATAVIIYPASANTIARLAMGLCDDPLTAIALSTQAPIIIAPAMESNMYNNPATQANLAILSSRGVFIIEPASGYLASGVVGVGRLVEPTIALGYIRGILGRVHGDLKGVRVVVTAGGTWEPVDPVRILTNRSTGKMGYAVAEAARDRGADVVLITAPTGLDAPAGVYLCQVETAEQMKHAVEVEATNASVLIMTAAVADYTPTNPANHKIKKGNGNNMLQLSLRPTPDILMGKTWI